MSTTEHDDRADDESLQSLQSSESHLGPVGITNQGESPELTQEAMSHLATRTTNKSLKTVSSRVPANNRRGMLGRFTILPEYEDARDYPESMKYTIVFIVALAAVNGPMGTSILLPAIDDVASDLNTSVSVVNISVGIYLISLGIFPLWWSAFSEKFGRRNIYIISFALLCCFSIGNALSKSIGMLIGFRILSGGCSASVQAVGAGTIADLYIQQERGTAMGIYYLGPLCGPLLAPILGGAIAEKWGWRGTQWFLVICSGVNLILLIFGLPETLRKQDNSAAIRELLKARLHQAEEDIKDEEQKIHKIDSETSGERNQDNDTNDDDLTPKPLRRRSVQSDQGLEAIERIITNLSRQTSRIENKDDAVTDVFLPFASRIETNKSQYLQVQKSNISRLKKELDEASEKDFEGDESKLTFTENFKKKFHFFMIMPLKSLHLFRYPPVLFALCYSAPCFAVLYFVNMTLSYCYARSPYNFSSVLVGLVYIPNSVTYIFASIYGGKWTDYLLKSYAKKHNGELVPESRLSYNVLAAVIIFPIALLITGWCFDTHQHWVTPLIGTALFGFASMIVIGTTVTYLVDSLPGRGATGVALNNLVRMLLAAVATFITEPLITAIGVGPLFCILAGLICLFAVNLYIIKKKGKHWRETYDLTLLYDKLEM